MEKYGVVLDPDKEKTAGKDKNCPKCGQPIKSDKPLHCDKCGTEPYEKTEDDGNAGHGGA